MSCKPIDVKFFEGKETFVAAFGSEDENLDAQFKDVGIPGKDGQDGKSAFEIAVANGFEGTESEWLEFLHGKDGQDGQDGVDGYTPQKNVDYFDGLPGKDGEDGKSAFEIAVANGFEGTESEWLESLHGKDGQDGEPGKDGKSGVYVGPGEMPEGYNVQIDPDGEPLDLNAMILAALNKPWTKLDEITFSEDGAPMSMTFENLGGMTEFLFKVEGLTNGATNSGMSVFINGYGIKTQPIPVTKAAANYCYVELKFNGLYWRFVRTGASNGATNYSAGSLSSPYNIEVMDGLMPAETMTISQHTVYYAKAGKLIIYGR